MKVYVEQTLFRMSFDLFAIERGSRIWRLRDGKWVMEEYEEGTADLEPSLSLPREMLEEIVRAAADHVHANDATVSHLKDATGTRDRLLSLIEKRGLR